MVPALPACHYPCFAHLLAAALSDTQMGASTKFDPSDLNHFQSCASCPLRRVMPPRYEGDFACYDGWLPPTAPGRQGVPAAFSPAGFPAASSLARLVQQQQHQAEKMAQQQQQQQAQQQQEQTQQPHPQQQAPQQADKLSITLLGFSKGAIVLHQVCLAQPTARR